jgi:hypothetical protein
LSVVSWSMSWPLLYPWVFTIVKRLPLRRCVTCRRKSFAKWNEVTDQVKTCFL